MLYLSRASNPDFDRAYLKSGGQAESVAEALGTAADRLEEIVPLVPEHKKNPDVQAAVAQVTRFFALIVEHFPKARQQYGLTLR